MYKLLNLQYNFNIMLSLNACFSHHITSLPEEKCEIKLLQI